jgi:hypothetical protein
VAYLALLARHDGAATLSPLWSVRTVSFARALIASRLNAFVPLEALPARGGKALGHAEPRAAAFRPFYARRRIPDVMRWSKPKFED